MATTNKTRHSGRGQMFVLAFGGLFMAFFVMLVSTLMYGGVCGEEFSPDSFERRSFSYYALPILGWQVSPIDRDGTTNELELDLVAQKFITATAAGTQRWDLVRAGRSRDDSDDSLGTGEASILCHYLDAQDSDNHFIWKMWTEANRAKALVLWPTVAKLSRQELYVFVPDLLNAARGADSAETLQTEIDRILAAKYLTFAKAHQSMQNHVAAVELFGEAISHQPETAEAFQGRASSLAALGKSDQAAADIAAAKRFGARL